VAWDLASLHPGGAPGHRVIAVTERGGERGARSTVHQCKPRPLANSIYCGIPWLTRRSKLGCNTAGQPCRAWPASQADMAVAHLTACGWTLVRDQRALKVACIFHLPSCPTIKAALVVVLPTLCSPVNLVLASCTCYLMRNAQAYIFRSWQPSVVLRRPSQRKHTWLCHPS
jgi:hypothetical protein